MGVRTAHIEISHYKLLRSASKDAQLAWTAGFLEGEGSFLCSNERPRIHASQVDRQPLELLQHLFGGSLQVDMKLRSPGRQPLHGWFLDGVRARELMAELQPFMSDRRKQQIENALSARLGWGTNGA